MYDTTLTTQTSSLPTRKVIATTVASFVATFIVTTVGISPTPEDMMALEQLLSSGAMALIVAVMNLAAGWLKRPAKGDGVK